MAADLLLFRVTKASREKLEFKTVQNLENYGLVADACERKFAKRA